MTAFIPLTRLFPDTVHQPRSFETLETTKMSVLVRSHGRAHIEIWPATRWPQLKNMLNTLSERT